VYRKTGPYEKLKPQCTQLLEAGINAEYYNTSGQLPETKSI
jgi:hypothetical protein